MAMPPVSFTLPTSMHPRRRRMRSATYHRLAAASKDMGLSAAGMPTVLPTRVSLLRRVLRSIGCAT